MTDQPTPPFDDKQLESPEYRERLMRKLNCLIAVLEVANAKVKKSLKQPEPDTDRLEKIKSNLTSTLEVCRRARRALERREQLPADLPDNLAKVVRKKRERAENSLPTGARYEMTSAAEHARFDAMGKVTATELASCDLDELIRKLQD